MTKAATFIVVALVMQAAAQRPAAPDPRTGLIVGQVVDAASGRPVAGAIVSINGPVTPPAARGVRPTLPPRILTGSDGYFVFRDLPLGSFTINASKSGYVEGASGRRRPGGPSQPISLQSGERVGDAVVRMWKFAAISGTVVDEAGEPMVNVQVRALRRTALAGRRRYVNTSAAMTDDRGMFRFGSLVPGDYVVAATFRPTSIPVMMSARGLPGGDPAYGIGRGAPLPPPSDDRGPFVYPPTFSPSGPANQAAVITVDSGEERTADITLHPVRGVRISGVVAGLDGPGATLLLQLIAMGNEEITLEQDGVQAMTDNAGAFTFPVVAPGQYTIRAVTRSRPPGATSEASTLLWTETPVAVGRSNIDNLVVALQKGLRVSGRIEFDGSIEKPQAQRLAQVPIVVEPAEGPLLTFGGGMPPTRVDATGQFTSGDVPPGRYFVRIAGSPPGWMFKSAMYNGRDVADTPLELQGGDASGVVITFTDRWSGLRGVVQSSTGADADASVLVFPLDQQMWTAFGMNPRRIRSARTNAAGEYNFPSLLPGDYYVAAIPDDQAADWQDAKFMETLSRIATRVNIAEGEKKTQDLHTREVQ